MKTSIPPILITFALAYVALSPTTQAQLPPPTPDGGYAGDNTVEGSFALESNTFGSGNTAIGASALRLNTIGFGNTATGKEALSRNTTGGGNTATGASALSNSTGSHNTANGFWALLQNTTGTGNTATGASALHYNTAGSGNTALGFEAGKNATTGSGNVYIGHGMQGVAGEANHTYIRNIQDTTVSGSGTETVTVNLTTGLLGHMSSSRRYKEDIRPMDKASEAVFALKPVTYRYKKEIDPSQSPAFGLIAEDVAQANPDLVARNSKDQPESVHYDAVNAMLLNEFLKEHKAFVEEQHKVQELEANAAQQQKQIEALTTGLQNVSAQLEANKPASQLARANDQ